MIESIFQTFVLLATFDTILISVSIAIYAVSASYLGRETRLTRGRMEKRKQKLSQRVTELQAKGLSIEDLKNEIDEAENDMTVLGRRSFLLSWIGAVIVPSIFFIASLIIAILGMNTEVLQTELQAQDMFERQSLTYSASLLGFGFLFLMLVINAIDSTAKKFPVPEIEVYFENETKTIESKRSTEVSFNICVRNKGENTAIDLDVLVLFPPTFKPQPSEYGKYELVKQARVKGIDFPDYTSAIIHRHSLHVETVMTEAVKSITPDEPKIYEIPVYIYERKTGLTKDKLTIQVTN